MRTEPIRPTGDAGDGWGRAAAYDAYADGLHTYAIWSLHDHDAAVDALYCAFVIADRNVRQLRQPEYIQPWLYAILRRECSLRGATALDEGASDEGASDEAAGPDVASGDASRSASASSISSSISSSITSSPRPVSGRLRPPVGAADPGGSLASLERNLRRAEFHSLEWPESEGLAPAHREILELTIRHGLDSHGLGLVLGLGQSARADRSARSGRGSDAPLGSVGSQGFGVLADAWRELERSLAAVAVAKASTEHCAQLAELTFGWSGRLNATLRAPLTDHVDGCTRCQHYLHTVIGTPAAPTILPFVAAPRSLREIVLSELRDPELALRLGVDHDLIAARIQQFTPDGFPVVGESSPIRRRSGRRAAPKRGSGPESKRGTVRVSGAAAVAPSASAPASAAPAPPHAAAAAEQTREKTGGDVRQHQESDGRRDGTSESPESLPRRVPGVNRPRIDARKPSSNQDPEDARTSASSSVRPPARGDSRASEGFDFTGVYRTPGSWAARVLPPDSETEWRPATTESLPSLRSGAADGGGAGRGTASSDTAGRDAAGGDAADGDARERFISTPSGRFAFRAPAEPGARGAQGARTQPSYTGLVSSAYIEGMAGVRTGSRTGSAHGSRTGSGTGTAHLPRFAAPAPEAPRGPDGKPRLTQPKSRPMRQVVLSAVTLGAVGAAAAATAALLGIASDGHSSQLIDSMPSQDPISGSGGGGLGVSVSTPPVPLASSSVRSSAARGVGKSGAAGGGIGGTVRSPAGGTPGSGTDPGANAADFHVSVNQRAADPNSVTILLRNSGSAPIAWQAAVHDTWIVLSQTSGTLGGGQSQAITATATSAAPSGSWTSTVTFAPGGAVVTLHGGYSNPSSAPASPPASGGSPGSTPPGSPPGTTSPTPAPSTSRAGVGPSAVRSTNSAPAGAGGGSAASPSSPSSSSQTAAPSSTASGTSAGSTAPSPASAQFSPRHAAGPR